MTAAADPEVPVLARRDDALVLAKPAGWLVHPSAWAGPPERTLVDLVREAHGPGYHPVHRLDRQTSGVVVFARGPDAVRAWQAALDAPEADKRYLALVRGQVLAATEVDHPIKDTGGVLRDARSFVEPVVRRPEPWRSSLVRVRIYTGRTHQVRRHLAHLSHPVIGDANHGKGALNRAFRDGLGLARMALHARSLALVPPDATTPARFVAPVPDDLAAVLDALWPDWRAALADVERATG